MLKTEFKFGDVKNLASLIKPEESRVQFQGVFANENGGVALVAFKAGQALDTHLAPAELMVNVLEGEIEFTMIDVPHQLRAGDFMLVGEGVPHSVKAKTDAKMMLVKIKSDK